MKALGESGEALHAPRLLRFEVANALTRKIVGGEIDAADAERAWRQIVAMPIGLHEPDDGPASHSLPWREDVLGRGGAVAGARSQGELDPDPRGVTV